MSQLFGCSGRSPLLALALLCAPSAFLSHAVVLLAEAARRAHQAAQVPFQTHSMHAADLAQFSGHVQHTASCWCCVAMLPHTAGCLMIHTEQACSQQVCRYFLLMASRMPRCLLCSHVGSTSRYLSKACRCNRNLLLFLFAVADVWLPVTQPCVVGHLA